MSGAVFLDKDGTLIEDVPYNVDPALIRLKPGAADALSRLAAAGLALAVVSNQSGVARGLFEIAALDGVAARLRALLPDVELADIRFCPHHPDGHVAAYAVECTCRKPGPLMLMQSALLLGVRLEESWMIGDILDDVEAGNRAGCRTILLDPGGETEWRRERYRFPHYTAGGLAGAADLILAHRRWAA